MEEGESATGSQQKRKILLVEDSKPVLAMLTNSLNRKYSDRYDIIPVKDGMQGLSEYIRNEEDIGLLITDLALPELHGLDLIRTIRARNETVPILAISQVHSEKEALDKGANTYLAKPFDVRDVYRVIDRFMYKN